LSEADQKSTGIKKREDVSNIGDILPLCKGGHEIYLSYLIGHVFFTSKEIRDSKESESYGSLLRNFTILVDAVCILRNTLVLENRFVKA